MAVVGGRDGGAGSCQSGRVVLIALAGAKTDTSIVAGDLECGSRKLHPQKCTHKPKSWNAAGNEGRS